MGTLAIIEGIDRVGKTTLASMLKEKGFMVLKDEFMLDVPAEEFSVYSLGKLDTTVALLKKLVIDEDRDVVMDRLILTELAYGQIYRDGKVKALEAITLEKKLKESIPSSILVYVEPTDIDEANERAGVIQNACEQVMSYYFKASCLLKVRTDFNRLAESVKVILDYAHCIDFYFASPFFNKDQVEREERIKKCLRDLGYRVFSPKEHSHLKVDSSIMSQEKTFRDNIKYLHMAKAVFAITDGKDVGTIWEAGYAYGIHKPIVYYAETLGDKPFNLMLARSGAKVIRNQYELTHDLSKILYQPVGEDFVGGIE